MHHLYEIGGGFLAGIAIARLYGNSALFFAEKEAKKLRDELNALKSKAKAKL